MSKKRRLEKSYDAILQIFNTWQEDNGQRNEEEGGDGTFARNDINPKGPTRLKQYHFQKSWEKSGKPTMSSIVTQSATFDLHCVSFSNKEGLILNAYWMSDNQIVYYHITKSERPAIILGIQLSLLILITIRRY
jgi:hypothetical protein